MNDYLQTLEAEFQRLANPEIAAGQKAYLKNKFEFFGLKTPQRRELSAAFLAKEFLPERKLMHPLVKILWEKPQREYHHFAQELVYGYRKSFQENDLELFEYMVLTNSWWDTVDFVAPKLIGPYFLRFPEKRDDTIAKWLASGNLWLQRSCVIFQLKYKKEFDSAMLAHVIHSLSGSKEFFINKAIGWALREYGKQNPEWVVDFASQATLSNLSRREGLRRINL